MQVTIPQARNLKGSFDNGIEIGPLSIGEKNECRNVECYLIQNGNALKICIYEDGNPIPKTMIFLRDGEIYFADQEVTQKHSSALLDGNISRDSICGEVVGSF